MQIIVLAEESQKKELSGESYFGDIIWIKDEHEFLQHTNADVFIDLKFWNDEDRKGLLEKLLPKLVIINSVTDIASEINPAFVRINGWNTFLSSSITEAACTNEVLKPMVEEVFSKFIIKIEWLPDEPGFVTA